MKFGRKVHCGDSVTEKVIGSYTCPLCGEDGKLLDRQGAGFRLYAVECRHGHRHTLAKQIYKKYDVGDVVRIYESTFGKDSVLRLDSFYEGPILRIYPYIIDYKFDMLVEKAVFNGKDVPADGWIYGHVIHGHDHHRRDVELIRKAEDQYKQLMLFD